MKFTTLFTIAVGFAGLTVGQLGTTLTSVDCINPAFCTTGTPTRSNVYTSSITDSTDLTRTITGHRRQVSPSSACTTITSRSDYNEWATPISTHIQCGPDKSKPTCSALYECGCNSSAFTRAAHPETHLCYPTPTAPLSSPDTGGGRSQRWVAREAKQTKAPHQTWTRSSKPRVAARATSLDFGGRRSQRRVAREAEATPIEPCLPGYFGLGCFPRPIGPPANAIEARQAKPTPCSPGHVANHCKSFVSPPQIKPTHSCPPGWFGPDCPPRPWPPANAAITLRSDLEARQQPHETSSPTPTATPTTSVFHCPSGTCGPACRWGPGCNKLFGRITSQDFGGGRSQRRVTSEAEATAMAEVVHSTLFTLGA
jgi:hypothetical protein